MEGEDKESEKEEEEEAEAGDGDEEEEEETEEEEEDETTHGKKEARGALKKPKREEGHSDDDPQDNPVVPEKGFSAKAARSTMLEVKQEPHAMADKKKRKSEERSPPKVPPTKSEAEVPKKKKDKDKEARGQMSFSISGKGPKKSINAAPTRAQKSQCEGGCDRDLDTMQRILEADFNATLRRLMMHYYNTIQGMLVEGNQVQARDLFGTPVSTLVT